MLTPPQTTTKTGSNQGASRPSTRRGQATAARNTSAAAKKNKHLCPSSTGKTGRGYSSRGPRNNNQPAVPPSVTPYFLRRTSLFTQPVTEQQPYFTTLLFTGCCLNSKRDCRSKPAKPHRDCSALLLKKTPPGVLQTCIVQTIKRSLKASF